MLVKTNEARAVDLFILIKEDSGTATILLEPCNIFSLALVCQRAGVCITFRENLT